MGLTQVISSQPQGMQPFAEPMHRSAQPPADRSILDRPPKPSDHSIECAGGTWRYLSTYIFAIKYAKIASSKDYFSSVLVGRPVLMAGTAFKAARNELSGIAANALMPARMSSLFLTELASLPARCLRSSSTVYSVFGIVKLSRTNFFFLILAGFSALGWATALMFTFAGAAFTAAISVGVLGGTLVGAVLTGVETVALTGEALDFMTRFAAAGLAAGRTGAVEILAVTGVAAAVPAYACLAGVVLLFVVIMSKPSKRNEVYSLYRLR